MQLIHRGVLRLTLSELDRTRPGWDEELSLALAGLDAAGKVLADREKHSQAGPLASQTGQPVFGMPGRTFDPQGGFR